MMRVETVDPERPSPEIIRQAAAHLARGELVVFPTETVYGLGAHGLQPAALDKIFRANGRPTSHPLILHVADIAMARDLAREWPHQVEVLARACWPGPLTLIVEKSDQVPLEVTGGGSTVGLRVPANRIARDLISALGAPIAAPSANRYQTLSPTRAEHVHLEGVAMLLDGGPTAHGIESTVVDARVLPVRVLRPGALEIGRLRELVGEVDTAVLESGEGIHLSPGLDRKHYAPAATLLVLDTEEAITRELARASLKRCAVITRTFAVSGTALSVRLPNHPEGYAEGMFAALHQADDAHVDLVIVEGVPEDDAWWGVRDRLMRASHRG